MPYARNARTHSDEQVAQIAASIREWGWTTPCLLDEDGGIIAGHGRVLAAKKLGIAEIPCMVARGWSDAQKRAYILADNKLALNAGWDNDLLKIELGDLQALDFNLELTGFSLDEIGALTADKNSGLTDPDDAPEPPGEPVSRLGDIWVLGKHRLACGDSTDADCVKRLCDGVVPDLANCDPPYGINVVKSASVGGAKAFGKVGGGKPHPFAASRRQSGTVGRSDTHPVAFKSPQGRGHAPARKAIIKPGIYAPIIGDDSTETAIASYTVLVSLGVSAIVLWGGNYFANALPPSRCWLVWDKENTGTFADAELAWTNRDAIVRLIRHQWSGLIKASERGERRVHPTQKPVALAEWVIETIAPEAATVIDLFGGSGSTLIACERKKKQAFIMEMSPAYCDVMIERWQRFTGQVAFHEQTRSSFADLSSNRKNAA